MVHHAWTIDCHDTSIRAARFQTAELSGGISRTCGPDRTPDISIVRTVLRLAVRSVALPLDDALSYSSRVSVVEAEATTSRPTDDGGMRGSMFHTLRGSSYEHDMRAL